MRVRMNAALRFGFLPFPDQPSRGARAMRVLSVLFVISLAVGAHAQSATNPCPNAQPVPPQMKLPAFIPSGEPVEVEKQLLTYLNTLAYRNLGWCRDKWVRDTGPLIQGTAATVHPAVHIYYSPEVSKWLLNGRKGEIPDGAVIIKEHFSPVPAGTAGVCALSKSSTRTPGVAGVAMSDPRWYRDRPLAALRSRRPPQRRRHAFTVL
jgi:hypothetical protein